jgi:hypothetical protein
MRQVACHQRHRKCWSRGTDYKGIRRLQKLIVSIILVLSVIATAEKASADKNKVEARCPQYEQLLREYKLPVKKFSFIMWRESKCVPQAIGWNYRSGMSHRDCKLTPAKSYRKCKAVKSYDIGLLQINSSWRTVTQKICKTKEMLKLQQVECNLKVASHLYRNGGDVHWLGSSGTSNNKKK